MKFPFEVGLNEIILDPDPFIDAVFSCLESEFLIMPKGPGFVEYPVFERGYEALKKTTRGFERFVPEEMFQTIISEPIVFVVLRAMLGFTPPEWGYIAAQKTGVMITQGFVRDQDRKIRMQPEVPISLTDLRRERLEALIQTACDLLKGGPASVERGLLHRLDKADTKNGLESLRHMAHIGVPYAMLLYERFLGRPFAGHRDSVSELKGDVLESAIEDVLTKAGISFRKTKRAERIEGFDQVPDFIIPSEYNPQVIIEAKITEDDGTARDKVTRIQHLGELSLQGRSGDNPKYEVIACIDGRGFSVRREDMKKILLATRGKTFTSKTLNHLIENTRLKEFKSR